MTAQKRKLQFKGPLFVQGDRGSGRGGKFRLPWSSGHSSRVSVSLPPCLGLHVSVSVSLFFFLAILFKTILETKSNH